MRATSTMNYKYLLIGIVLIFAIIAGVFVYQKISSPQQTVPQLSSVPTGQNGPETTNGAVIGDFALIPDADSDGLADDYEKEIGTDPNNPDTDGDGGGDGIEVEFNTNPRAPDKVYGDSDQDGLPDYLETHFGTDPNNPDTDGDGFKDGEEVLNGYNPKGEGRL